MKPNTFLLKCPKKTFYYTIPIRFSSWNIFLINFPVFGASDVVSGQKNRTIVMTQAELFWNFLSGTISTHNSLIQCISSLQSPSSSIKTVSHNLTAPIVHHTNEGTPTITATVNLCQIRRPKRIRSIYSRTLPLNFRTFSPWSVSKPALPALKLHNPMNFLDVNHQPLLEPKMSPNTSVTKSFFLIQNAPDPQSKLFINFLLLRGNRSSISLDLIQSRPMKSESRGNNRSGVTALHITITQPNCFVFFKRATSCNISTWSVNCPTLRSNRPISFSLGSFRLLNFNSVLPPSRKRSLHSKSRDWLMPFSRARWAASVPRSNSNTTSVLRFAVQREPFLILGSDNFYLLSQTPNCKIFVALSRGTV